MSEKTENPEANVSIFLLYYSNKLKLLLNLKKYIYSKYKHIQVPMSKNGQSSYTYVSLILANTKIIFKLFQMMLSSLGKTPVKSTAVVKYSAVQSPATFAQLQCNTDLNLPPSNWLSSSAESYGLQSVWSQSTGFSSFRMAHMFPDCVGEVDVVSDAENIKKLLKLPYNNGLISMMVHRIENTLLLDDFDIHKYLLRQAESDWEWLKKFFYDNIFHNLGDKEKRLFHKADTRNSLQQKNLVSKFLYHSLVLPDDGRY